MKKTRNRLLILLLCCTLAGSLLPQRALATGQAQESGTAAGTEGLCEHHMEHTPECGYTEGTPGTLCGHEHKDECYTDCVHEHNSECSPKDSVSGNQAGSGGCAHVCSRESGCITENLNCKHEHNQDCGYLPSIQGTPCAYVCEICRPRAEGGEASLSSVTVKLTPEQVQELINRLPTLDGLKAMAAEQQQAAYLELLMAYDAYKGLTGEEQGQLAGAEIFESLFEFFNSMAAPLGGTPQATWSFDGGVSAELDDTGLLTISGSGAIPDNPQWSYMGTDYTDEIKTVTIGEGVTAIGNTAFYNCENLTKITIPDSVTAIGSNAFYGCTGLKEMWLGKGCMGLDYFFIRVGIPDSAQLKVTVSGQAEKIPDGCFLGRTGLKEIVIPERVTAIGYSAFYGCENLTKITIPDSVTTIGSSVFDGCTGLKEMWLGKGCMELDDFDKLSVPDSAQLKVTVSGRAEKVPDGYFKDQSGLTGAVIGDGVKSIGEGAFAGCTKLAAVTIGKDVQDIGKEAFYNCTSLAAIYSKNQKAPTLAGGAGGVFSGYPENIVLTIPAGATGYESWPGYRPGDTWQEAAGNSGSTWQEAAGNSDGGGSHSQPPAIFPPNEGRPDRVQTPAIKPDKKGTAILGGAAVRNALSAKGHSGNGVELLVPIDNRQEEGLVTIRIPADVLDELAKERVRRFEITTRGFPCFGFAPETVKMLDVQSRGGDLLLRMKRTKPASKEARRAVGSRPVWEISLSWVKNDVETPLSDWQGQTISVGLPYEQQTGDKKAGQIFAVYEREDGSVEWLTKSSYHAGSRSVLLEAAHFGVCGVGYRKSLPAFSDIKNHWAGEDICFAASRGLLSGTGNKAFSPDAGLTRGMLTEALLRLEGRDPAAYRGGDELWADSPVTREQLAVLMARYAREAGYSLPKTLEAAAFADSGQISPEAKEAVRAMQQAGIFIGKSGNRFDPKGVATRAETAALLRRFVETVAAPRPSDVCQVGAARAGMGK